MISKISIVAIGLYRPGTGFTRVLSSLFEKLKVDFDIHWVGIGYKGPQLDLGYKIYPCNVNGGDMFGGFLASQIVEETNAKIVLFLNDFWMIKNYNVTFKDKFPNCLKCAYIPLDGSITSFDQMGDLSVLDHLILYTEFAKNEVINIFQSKSIEPPNINVISHGTDTSSFYPLNYIDRKKIFNIDTIDSSTFVILNANRYSIRKDIQCTLMGFAEFYKRCNPNSVLCLHQPGISPEHKNELLNEIDRLGIIGQVVLNPFGDGNYVSDDQLNQLYNACSVGVNTSLGEGWGMIAFEHGACKKPQIVPNHTACGELWKDYGLTINIKESTYLPNNPFQMYKSDPLELSKALETLYFDKTTYTSCAKKAYQNANLSKYKWSSIAEQWKKCFNTVLQA